MRWWQYFLYAHDPEARRLAAENAELTKSLHDRFSLIEKHLGKPDTSPIPPVPIRLDCGHKDISWARDANGVTWCRRCHQGKFAEP